jgi:predicted DCC family thiol-disulfide oxidoreductase YuxK
MKPWSSRISPSSSSPNKWTPVFGRIRNKRAARFDGACGMCTRSRDLLLRLNRTGDLSTEPLQGDNVAERLGIPASRLLETVRWLDSSGDVYAGAEAANAALSAAIGTKLPLFVYRIPGIQFLQDAVYRWVATHRYRFPGKTPYCESHPAAC